MGLDMYLTATRRVGDWQHSKADERALYKTIMGAIGKPDWRMEDSPHAYVKVCVAYWRKANQVHAFFVENCQQGNDERQTSEVSREQLQTLIDTAKTVLKASDLVEGEIVESYRTNAKCEMIPNMVAGKVIRDASCAKALLPAREGFFFGSYEYDEYYIADLKDTVSMLEKALTAFPEKEGWDFEYYGSW